MMNEFLSSRSTAGFLFVITHRISKALDNKSITRATALHVSKAFDKV